MDNELTLLAKVLEKKGFKTFLCDNKEEAILQVHNIMVENAPVGSIGFGNSMTIRSLGLHESLNQYVENTYIHEPVGTSEVDRKALTSDFYLCSANAVSLDGHIVNIDGTGNRTAATCFGPKHIVYIIGKNKVVSTLDEAMFRAQNVAAVELAKKYHRNTPCVTTGKCEDCNSPECICAITTIHRRKPYGIEIIVVIVNEALGL